MLAAHIRAAEFVDTIVVKCTQREDPGREAACLYLKSAVDAIIAAAIDSVMTVTGSEAALGGIVKGTVLKSVHGFAFAFEQTVRQVKAFTQQPLTYAYANSICAGFGGGFKADDATHTRQLKEHLANAGHFYRKTISGKSRELNLGVYPPANSSSGAGSALSEMMSSGLWADENFDIMVLRDPVVIEEYILRSSF